jgi:predicted anti-sigma-YlaC factor YlaD
MCHLNKNSVLTLYFSEGSQRELRKMRAHLNRCPDCRDYLSLLEQTDQTLHHWQDEAPPSQTLDLILERLPRTQMKPAAARPTLSTAPLFLIAISILSILGIVFFLHDRLRLLPVWQRLQEFLPVQLLGSFGTAVILLFLVGVFITLSVAPILILESQSQKYRYRFP